MISNTAKKYKLMMEKNDDAVATTSCCFFIFLTLNYNFIFIFIPRTCSLGDTICKAPISTPTNGITTAWKQTEKKVFRENVIILSNNLAKQKKKTRIKLCLHLEFMVKNKRYKFIIAGQTDPQTNMFSNVS